MSWKFLLVFVAVSLFEVTSAIYSSEDHATVFMNGAHNQLFDLYNNISDETYKIDDKLYFTALQDQKMAQSIRTLMLDISKEAKKYNTEKFKNPTIIKAIRRLRFADLFVLEDDFFSSLSTSLSALQHTAIDKDICNYVNNNECDMAYLPDIRKVISNSMDAKELEYYWEEWRQKQLGYGIYHFINVVELIRRAAELNGVSAREFLFRNYDDALFFGDMEVVMQQLKPFYQEFHAYIRQQLSVKYGRTVLNQEQPIPDHLMEQVTVQAWKKQSVLNHAYPKERLPNLQEGLESRGFDISRIFNHAEDFYVSLGLDPIPPPVRRTRFKHISQGAAGKDCKADIFDQTSKVYMKFCPASTFKRFLQTHGYLGRVHYALEKVDLPSYFFPSFDLEYPLGESVILSASTPNHMNRAEILNQFNYTNELSINRLFRMGVHTMFNIPQYFVNTKVLIDVLDGNVKIEHINQHYWKLMDEYAGIEPPIDRKVKYLDFSYKFFEDIVENHQTRKFVSEMLGYQMYEAFCLLSGKFVRGDPNKPLHECDFYGNKDVGIAMKKMMRMGSTKSWREAISRSVESTTALSANSLLEYYKPLYEWLKEKNRKTKTKVGWAPSTKLVF